MSIKRLKTIVFASAVALAAPGAAVAADQATVPLAAAQAVSLPSAGSVAAIYDQYKMKPIWFRNGAPSVAATQLVQILRRSPLDGLGSGPQMADQIEAAIRPGGDRRCGSRYCGRAADVVVLGALRPDDQAADAGHDLRL